MNGIKAGKIVKAQVDLPRGLWKRVKDLAARKGVEIKDVVEELLAEGVEKEETKMKIEELEL